VRSRLRKSGCPQGPSDKTECQVWLLEIRVRCGERKQERADARAPVTVLTYKPGLSFSSGRECVCDCESRILALHQKDTRIKLS
jgi:hypothetical protein